MSSTEPDQQQGSGEYIDAVEMLTHAQGLAFQLRDLLLNDDDQINISLSGDRLVLAEDLIDKIHGSFTNTISALDRRHSADSAPDQIAESGEISGRPRPRSAPASRRRRRETSESQTRTEISSSLVHDGYGWRKYGQKPILDAKHPRKYYKCTYKDQHNCPAKKQVQQISDDPVKYKTVYIFNHTCTTSIISNAANNAPTTSAAQPASDHMNHASSSTMILDFQSNLHHSDHNNSYNNDLMNDQTTEDLSDVGGVLMPNYMEDFMNNYSTDYSPYLDTEEWWFD